MLTRYEPLHIGPPRLVVTNPKTTHLQEVIYAAPRDLDTPNEEWCFWWAWGDPICPWNKSKRRHDGLPSCCGRNDSAA
ncbi:hypothetical protein GCM10023191_065030 [Actinoallomurus oryzae]|uniref:Uncharacterized protein n=1 Tax=Actinoallomurus oryzae TaxID=502180 RepID=A0ABP8QNL7_9ACTN